MAGWLAFTVLPQPLRGERGLGEGRCRPDSATVEMPVPVISDRHHQGAASSQPQCVQQVSFSWLPP